jgi:hypothetical protein
MCECSNWVGLIEFQCCLDAKLLTLDELYYFTRDGKRNPDEDKTNVQEKLELAKCNIPNF